MLAAGYATRLWPLTKNQPKALLDINGKAMIEYPLQKVSELSEVDAIYIVTNNKFYNHIKEWVKDFEAKIPIKVLNDLTMKEETKLGAIGDFIFVIDNEKIDDDIVVVNADNIFNFSLKPACDFFKEKKAHVLTVMDLAHDIESVKKSGVVEVDENNKVVSFEEKPEKPKSTLTSLGIYFYPKSSISLIKKYADDGNDQDKIGYLNGWLSENGETYAFMLDGKWEDVGTLDGLEAAREEFK